MDGLALRAVINELSPLVGGKIDKVQQPEKDTLLFTLRAAGSTSRLFVCTHAENGRIQLTHTVFDNPSTAPAFCMLLRRHLLGGRITAISQSRPDRVCILEVQAKNELMDEVRLQLVIELMGKHANVILVGGDGKILDCLRHISPSETTLRVLLPGFTYEAAPSQGKRDPFLATEADFLPVFAAPAPVRALTDTFEGVSKATATALLTRCQTPAALHRLFDQFREGLFTPTVVYYAPGEPGQVLPFAAPGMGVQQVPEESMSLALDRYYAERDAAVRMKRHGASLRRIAENALSRAENKRKSYLEALHNESQLEQYKLYGELILANLHRLKPGQTQLAAENYYTDPVETVPVPLDGALSPQENAKRYFKQYRKGKTAREYATAQLDGVNGEIDYLTGVLENIDSCDTLSELEEISEELIAQKYKKPEKKRVKQQFVNASKPLALTASDGTPIYVGKNNKQNEWLTLRFAGPEDYFFHAKNMPGSHVILACHGEPGETALREAAVVAAYYSSGRSATSVPIDYTPRKYIKKPAAGRPGLVIYHTNKTIYAAPDGDLVRRLSQGGQKQAQAQKQNENPDAAH